MDQLIGYRLMHRPSCNSGPFILDFEVSSGWYPIIQNPLGYHEKFHARFFI